MIKKIYIMTDLEGAAGVLNFKDWCTRDSKYYEKAKEFLTHEVNAAIAGFSEAGVEEFIVGDGHGPGGISIEHLDPRACLMRGWSEGWPMLLDKTFDAIAWVGQHAKAGTEYAHIAHTQDAGYIDLSVNGISIGEFGQFALCAGELGVRAVFAAGDKALCEEAQALIPGIETACVKYGTTPGHGNEFPAAAYIDRNHAAVHFTPLKAREIIKEKAKKAIERAERENFGILTLKPPYKRVILFRTDKDQPKRIARDEHPSSISKLLNMPIKGEMLSC